MCNYHYLYFPCFYQLHCFHFYTGLKTMLSSRFYWIFICGNKPAKLVAPGPGLQAWTLDRQLLHLIFWKNIENIIITYWIFGMFELAIKTLKMKLRLKLSNKFRRSTNMHCTLQVILCQINIFCHQLTQHMKNDFVTYEGLQKLLWNSKH